MDLSATLPPRASYPETDYPDDRSTSATSTESRPMPRKFSTEYEDATSPSRSPSLDSSASSTATDETIVVSPQSFKKKGYATLKVRLLAVPYMCRKCKKLVRFMTCRTETYFQTVSRHKRWYSRKTGGSKAKKASHATSFSDRAIVTAAVKARKRPAPTPAVAEANIPGMYAPVWSQLGPVYPQRAPYAAAFTNPSVAYGMLRADLAQNPSFRLRCHFYISVRPQPAVNVGHA